MYKDVEADANSIEAKTKAIMSTEDVENLARNELGMLKQGEIVFKDADENYNKNQRALVASIFCIDIMELYFTPAFDCLG